jgi:hypothetical protein
MQAWRIVDGKAGVDGVMWTRAVSPTATDVALVLGHPIAVDPAWCDLSPMERLAEAEEGYADVEVVDRLGTKQAS